MNLDVFFFLLKVCFLFWKKVKDTFLHLSLQTIRENQKTDPSKMLSYLLLFIAFTTLANAAIQGPVAPPSQFTGQQSGIGSWFQTNSASSYMNGHS